MKLWVFAVLALLLVVWLFVDLAFYFDLSLEEEVEVVVPRGTSLRGIARMLEERGVTSSLRFLAFTLLSGRKTLIAGRYRLKKEMPVARLVELLAQGPPEVRVTLPEGLTAQEMAEILERSGVCRKEEYLFWVEHPEFFGKPWLLGIKTLEGFLFPDTYSFQVPTLPQDVITTQLSRFEALVLPLLEGKDVSLSLADIVTLSSIVEREARWGDEKPLVASVFLNRLKKNMRLESCATVVYALKKERGVVVHTLTREDLSFPSPFNTYLHRGLPPHPICNPGLSSIQAVLDPAETEYLYFVLQENGRHAFARTYEEHLLNKRGAP